MERHDGYEAAAHALPPLVNWVINNWLLLLLLLSEGYLMGSLFSRGWVDSIEAPSGWGWFHSAGVVLFFTAGAATAGLGLRASVACAYYLKDRRWGFAAFNLLTVVALTSSEAWASLSERSFHLVTSPADQAVIGWLGLPASTVVTPTLIVVSLILPFASLSFGFSQTHRPTVVAAAPAPSISEEGPPLTLAITEAPSERRYREIKQLLEGDSYLTVRELSEHLDCSEASISPLVQRARVELGLPKRAAARPVLRLANDRKR